MVNVTWHLAEEVWENRPGKRFSQVVCNDIRPGIYPNYIKYERNVETEKYIPILNSRGCITASWDGPMIVHGPIKFVNQVLRDYPSDYVFITDFKDNMRASDYMSKYPLGLFLNSDAYFTTYGMLRQNLINRNVFVRPNSAYKTFTGFELTLQNFEHEMSCLRQIQHVQDEEIFLIASAKDIQSEYRCFVIDGKVSSYSTYRWDNILDCRRDILPECLALAERVASYPYQLDNAYVVDVCMTDKGPKIVEFNSFSSSGVYACDLEKIVQDMNDLAVKEWNEDNI